MPLHYALSEAGVVAAALWAALALWRGGRRWGAAGLSLFGLAAAIGMVRIGGGLVDQLAPIHRLASQVGGMVGLVFVLAELARLHGLRTPIIGVAAAAAAAACVLAFNGAVGGLLFVAMLAAGACALALRPGSALARTGAAAGFLLMAPNIVLVRQSTLLGPDLSWHAYHLIAAIWVIAVALALSSTSLGRGAACD